jgi:hypothetical protein
MPPTKFRSTHVYEGMQVTAKTEDEVLDWLQMEYQKHDTDHYFKYVSYDGNVSISGQYGQYIFKNEDGSLRLVDGSEFPYEEVKSDE